MRALCILSVLTLSSCGTRAVIPTASMAAEQAGDPCVVGPRVISSPRGNGTAPVMASRRDQFAVVWVEAGEARRELRLQIFDAHGQAQAPSRALDALSSGGGDPQIATTKNGYAVVWSVDHGDTTDVMLERVDRRGLPLGPPTDVFESPTARPLAFAHVGDGFVIVWWQWAQVPHREVATWLDAQGRRLSDVELTRMPCDQPVVDLQPEPDGRARLAWEQQIDGRQRVIVGMLSEDGVVRQGSEYDGRDPALLRGGTVMTGLDEMTVLYAPFGAATARPLASGRMADGAVLGDDSVLCRVQRGSSQAGAADEELLCAREKAGGLLRERVLARSAHTLGVAQVADTSEGFAVALEGARPTDEDTEAVLVTVVQCND